VLAHPFALVRLTAQATVGGAFGDAQLPYARLETMAASELAPGIVVDPAVRLGRPVIRGTRVPVDVVVGQLAAGLSADQVAEEYRITRDDVLAALAYAAKVLATEQVRAVGWKVRVRRAAEQ